MKTNIILPLAALALGGSVLLATAQDNNNNDGPPPGASTQQGPGGRQAGPHRQPGFHLLPPRAEEQLNLTDDQKKQVAALEAETKAKLEKILTPEQMQKMKDMRPMMRQRGPQMRGGPDGFGGPGNRGPGNGPGGEFNRPPGPPPGQDGGGNNPPAGPPPGDN